jgi:hypothetical protein
MAPRFNPTPKPPALDPFRGPDSCCGCEGHADPDGLCDACIARREEYGEHSTACDCDGCRWYRATDQGLRARGLK